MPFWIIVWYWIECFKICFSKRLCWHQSEGKEHLMQLNGTRIVFAKQNKTFDTVNDILQCKKPRYQGWIMLGWRLHGNRNIFQLYDYLKAYIDSTYPRMRRVETHSLPYRQRISCEICACNSLDEVTSAQREHTWHIHNDLLSLILKKKSKVSISWPSFPSHVKQSLSKEKVSFEKGRENNFSFFEVLMLLF